MEKKPNIDFQFNSVAFRNFLEEYKGLLVQIEGLKQKNENLKEVIIYGLYHGPCHFFNCQSKVEVGWTVRTTNEKAPFKMVWTCKAHLDDPLMLPREVNFYWDIEKKDQEFKPLSNKN